MFSTTYRLWGLVIINKNENLLNQKVVSPKHITFFALENSSKFFLSPNGLKLLECVGLFSKTPMVQITHNLICVHESYEFWNFNQKSFTNS